MGTVISTALRGLGFQFQSQALRFAITDSVAVWPAAFRWRLRYRTALLRECFQIGHADTGPQTALALRRLAEDLERRRPLAINALPLAVRPFDDFGNSAGPVEVDIRIQMLAMKLIDCFGMVGRDMAEAHVFANDRSVFRLHQTVVARPVTRRDLVCSISSFSSRRATV